MVTFCIILCNVAHHYNLYGDGHWQLWFESVIYLLHDEHHHHDHQGNHHITHIGLGYLIKDDLQGLEKITTKKSGWIDNWPRLPDCDKWWERFTLFCAYIYDIEWTTDAWHFDAQHKLELGHQDVDSSCCGETRHQSVRQVHDNKAHLQDTHCQLEETERPWWCGDYEENEYIKHYLLASLNTLLICLVLCGESRGHNCEHTKFLLHKLPLSCFGTLNAC